MYHLVVATPEKVIFDDQAISLTAPGALGYLGVLTDHAPLISPLKGGTVTITDRNKETISYRIRGGFLEVNHNEVSLLIDSLLET